MREGATGLDDAGLLDQCLAVEKRLRSAGNQHRREQAGLLKGVAGQTSIGHGAVLGIQHDHPAVAPRTVIFQHPAGGRQQVRSGLKVVDMRRPQRLPPGERCRVGAGDKDVRHDETPRLAGSWAGPAERIIAPSFRRDRP